MEFDIATLIHEIKARRPLWLRDFYKQSSRDLINRLWAEVATKMGVPKELVKTKWKGLRDNFRSELRKIPKKHPVHQSKWIYFNDMMFVKDQMTSRSSDANFLVSGDAENVNVDVDVYTMDDSDSDFDKIDDVKNSKCGYQFVNVSDVVGNCSGVDDNVQLDKSDDYNFGFNRSTVVLPAGLVSSMNVDPSKQSEKPCLLNNSFNYLPDSELKHKHSSKRRKLSEDCDKKCNINLHNDDDFYFLMSFLPTMKTLPPDKRMFLRFKIQNLVYNEVYNNSRK